MTLADRLWTIGDNVDHLGLRDELLTLARYVSRHGLDEIAQANLASIRANLRALTTHDLAMLAQITDIFEEATA